MSEEQTTQLINNELTERVNSAFIANDFTLLKGGSDNIVMIGGEKDGEKIDILVTHDELVSVVADLNNEISKEASNE